MKKTIEIDYEEGEIVYLITDVEQLPRQIAGYDLRRNRLRYWLAQAEELTLHSGYEIRNTEDTVLKTKH
jgi:hypothetical protein